MTKRKRENKAIADRMAAKHSKPTALEQALEAGLEKTIAKTETTTKPAQKEKEPTRSELMAIARKQGIKYFRILTKDELIEALANKQDNKPNSLLIDQAKKRWKDGWGSKKAQEAK